MVEIINRQGNKKQDGYIFPVPQRHSTLDKNESKIKKEIRIALDPINSALKVIAKDLELDPDLSTSYTRTAIFTSHQ